MQSKPKLVILIVILILFLDLYNKEHIYHILLKYIWNI